MKVEQSRSGLSLAEFLQVDGGLEATAVLRGRDHEIDPLVDYALELEHGLT